MQVTPENTAVDLVEQVVYPVDRERKRELLTHLVRTRVIDQALVFTRTKHGANKLAEQLNRDGIATAAIHGNKSQPQRVRALADFKAGRVLLLVATEVAARGLDIEALPHVVNFELPMVPADYVHRIGRTGRAGVTGTAVSLVCVDEAPLLRDIERLLRGPIPSQVDRRLRAGSVHPAAAAAPALRAAGRPAPPGTGTSRCADARAAPVRWRPPTATSPCAELQRGLARHHPRASARAERLPFGPMNVRPADPAHDAAAVAAIYRPRDREHDRLVRGAGAGRRRHGRRMRTTSSAIPGSWRPTTKPSSLRLRRTAR